MIGKVIHNGVEFVVIGKYGDLTLKPGNPNNDILEEVHQKQTNIFVDFEVDTIAEGTSEFDIVDCQVANILKVYCENFGTPRESVSVATERHEKNEYPIGGFAPGFYYGKCVTCKHDFLGDKRATQCETCAMEMVTTKIIENNKGGYEIENDYLQGFIDQFGDGPLGELDPKEWTVDQFLTWLKLNGYKIVK